MSGINDVTNTAIAYGRHPTPEQDLVFHGGKTIPHLSYLNFYVGGEKAWEKEEIQNIDNSLEAAMKDEHLNNVMVQYFQDGNISTTFIGSTIVEHIAPSVVSKTVVKELVKNLFAQGVLQNIDFSSTVCNFMLPKGTVLKSEADATASEIGIEHQASPSIIDTNEAASSLHGLAGYHGSVPVTGSSGDQVTIYYAVGVYSEIGENGFRNGIPVFDRPWKNIVATFYHELQEARTDPDVEDASLAGNVSFLGWVSRKGDECGDFPINEAGYHSLVFKEVPLANGSGTVPIQFQYSNAVHGPEGPIPKPHVYQGDSDTK
ncbi:hypothetical protein ACFFSY_17435 [Paenibacillus aurantiacus]|uniref:Uncharacterized protein n=1 Tax=Paenibacillus aurantiacus TaxID=1936118 RepID=A0ABV5KR50_9BACL